MKPKLLLSLALVLFIGLALQLPTRASVVDIHVLPANLSDLPISVKITDADFGKQFTVFYKTNETTSDEFLTRDSRFPMKTIKLPPARSKRFGRRTV